MKRASVCKPSTSKAGEDDRSSDVDVSKRPCRSKSFLTRNEAIEQLEGDELDYTNAYPDSDLEDVTDDKIDTDTQLTMSTTPADPDTTADPDATQPPANQPNPNQPNITRPTAPDKDFTQGWGEDFIPKDMGVEYDETLSGPILLPTGLNQDSKPIEFLQLFLGKYILDLSTQS